MVTIVPKNPPEPTDAPLSESKQSASLQFIDPSDIVSRVECRSLKLDGVERLKAKINRLGFQIDKPLRVYSYENGYRLIDGNHRLEAAIAEGLQRIPALVVDIPLNELEAIKQARESNEASEAVVPTTFVDDAELIWRMLEEINEETEKPKYTQQDVANTLKWSRGKISQYAMLSQISRKAWNLVATTFSVFGSNESEEEVADNATTVASPFTERLLREIVSLKPRQQIELVSRLSNDKEFKKAKFKTFAEQFKANNEIWDYVLSKVGKIPLGKAENKFRKDLMLEIYSDIYERNKFSKDWQKKEKEAVSTPGVDQLIQYVKDKIGSVTSITLIHGDFVEKVKEVADESVDLILTDPPYNIATERVMDYEGRSAVSYDFGEWDKVEKGNFLQSLECWAKEWYRIAKPSASIYVFMSDRYFSHARDELEKAGWQIKNPVAFCKTNPGTSPVKSDRKSAFELVLFAVKKSGTHTFHDIPNNGNQCLNYTLGGICQGNERVKIDKEGKTHPTQKPEWILTELIESSSNKNDVVFDGFMGVGSVPATAKKLGRKAIGIELDPLYFDVASERVANV
jgi:DNA modification methylase/ParB-like chromosome segregation protein Spo0J